MVANPICVGAIFHLAGSGAGGNVSVGPEVVVVIVVVVYSVSF